MNEDNSLTVANLEKAITYLSSFRKELSQQFLNDTPPTTVFIRKSSGWTAITYADFINKKLDIEEECIL